MNPLGKFEIFRLLTGPVSLKWRDQLLSRKVNQATELFLQSAVYVITCHKKELEACGR